MEFKTALLYMYFTLVFYVLQEVEAQSSSLPSSFLLYTDNRRHNVFVMDLQGMREYTIPIKGFKNPIACDYDPLKQVFFLLERATAIQGSEKAIVLTDTTFRNLNVQRFPGRSAPNGVAVDYISKLIYITDRGEDKIDVWSYDLRSHTTLVRNSEGLGEIVLDFAAGKMFYITYSDDGVGRTKIYSANGDGSNINVIIDESQGYFLGLAVDTDAKMIYWTHPRKHKIERCNYLGRNRETLIEEADEETIFRAVTVDDTYIYYSAYEASYLYRALKSGQQKQTFGPRIVNASFVTDLHVFEPNLRRGGTNRCSTRNGGCGQLCLPTPASRTCACDVKFTLDSNGRTCSASSFEKHLIITDKQRSGIFFIDVTTNATFRATIFNLNKPSGIAWNWNDMSFYWSDTGYNRLVKGCINRRDCLKIVQRWTDTIIPIEDIGIDHFKGQLYLVDSLKNRILQTDLTATRNKTIVNTNIDSPRGLALDLTRRLLFWTSIGREPRIERASMDDGTGRVVVINTGLISPNDIVLDPDQMLMYWCDGGKKVIEVASMTGRNRKVLFNKAYVYVSLALDQNHLYFFAVNSGIFRIDRTTGTGQQAVGSDSFLEVFDMIYVDTFQVPTNKVNPPLSDSPQAPASSTSSSNVVGGDSQGGDNTLIYAIAGGVGGGIILIIIIVVIVVCAVLLRKKRAKGNQVLIQPQQQPPIGPAPVPQVNQGFQQAPPAYPPPQMAPPMFAPPLQAPPPFAPPPQAPPSHNLGAQLLAQQLLQQNEQQKQQQAQMLMMQQQMVLLQAQVQNQPKQASQRQQQTGNKGLKKPPMPLPDETLYVNAEKK